MTTFTLLWGWGGVLWRGELKSLLLDGKSWRNSVLGWGHLAGTPSLGWPVPLKGVAESLGIGRPLFCGEADARGRVSPVTPEGQLTEWRQYLRVNHVFFPVFQVAMPMRSVSRGLVLLAALSCVYSRVSTTSIDEQLQTRIHTTAQIPTRNHTHFNWPQIGPKHSSSWILGIFQMQKSFRSHHWLAIWHAKRESTKMWLPCWSGFPQETTKNCSCPQVGPKTLIKKSPWLTVMHATTGIHTKLWLHIPAITNRFPQ